MRPIAVTMAAVLSASCAHFSRRGSSTEHPPNAGPDPGTLGGDAEVGDSVRPRPFPSHPDTDPLGEILVEDGCPGSLETINGFQDFDGCADDVPQPLTDALAGRNYTLREGKNLDRGAPSRALRALIKRVANALNAYPDTSIVVVVSSLPIEAQYGQDPSHRRAWILKELILKEGGIDPVRIERAGIGPQGYLVINFVLLTPPPPNR